MLLLHRMVVAGAGTLLSLPQPPQQQPLQLNHHPKGRHSSSFNNNNNNLCWMQRHHHHHHHHHSHHRLFSLTLALRRDAENLNEDSDDVMFDELFKKYGKVVYSRDDKKSPAAEIDDDADSLSSIQPGIIGGRKSEWKEYEEAVKRKDLIGALSFLKNKASLSSSLMGIGELTSMREWEVLDTCLNADDMKLVASAYGFLKDQRGFLPNFGKFSCIVLEGPRNVTPTVLKSSTGLPASCFSPKKWGLSGASAAVLAAFLATASFLLSQGIDIRPNLALLLALAFLDSTFLGGTCVAQISSYWPPYRRRILVHEAGHLLTAYLMGCPIRGVILDPIVAMQMGIQGQAGTQFWDEKMDRELAEGQLSGTAFDRYCIVLFAGIAAEALVYGNAEGGENDENLFRSLCVLLDPPFSIAQMSNQARWSVLQSYNLLKWHKDAHRAAVRALESGGSLSVVIRDIEEAMSSKK